jgi:hypothetical protein
VRCLPRVITTSLLIVHSIVPSCTRVVLTDCAELVGTGSKKGAEQNRWSAADEEEDAVEEDIQEVRVLYSCVFA